MNETRFVTLGRMLRTRGWTIDSSKCDCCDLSAGGPDGRRIHVYFSSGKDSRREISFPALLVSSKKPIKKLRKSDVEYFTYDELDFDVTTHELVPVHVLVDENELKSVLERYGTDRRRLPQMLSDDPIARYHGAKPGDVMKIYRRSPTAGEHVVYRLVVQSFQSS